MPSCTPRDRSLLSRGQWEWALLEQAKLYTTVDSRMLLLPSSSCTTSNNTQVKCHNLHIYSCTMQVLSESYKPLGSYLLFIAPLSGEFVTLPSMVAISVYGYATCMICFLHFYVECLLLTRESALFQISVVRFTTL